MGDNDADLFGNTSEMNKILRDPSGVSRRIFVGNCIQDGPIDEFRTELDKVFRKYGRIEAMIVKKRFAFIQYLNDNSANQAIKNENGKMFRNNRMEVKEAKAPEKNQENDNNDQNKAGGPPTDIRNMQRDEFDGPNNSFQGNQNRNPNDRFDGGRDFDNGGNDWNNRGDRGGRGGGGRGGFPPSGRGGFPSSDRGGRGGFSSPNRNEISSGRGRGDFRGGREGGGGVGRGDSRGGGRGDSRGSRGGGRGGNNSFSDFGGDTSDQFEDRFNNHERFDSPSRGGPGSGGRGGGPGGRGGGVGPGGRFGGPPERDGRGGPPTGDRWNPSDERFGSGPPAPNDRWNDEMGPMGPGRFQGKIIAPSPGVLRNISNAGRINDVEILVVDRKLQEYAEFIEIKLKKIQLAVDICFPRGDIPLDKVIANMSSRGTLYAIVVMVQHEQRRSITLHILHGMPQEHRNIPVEDALELVEKNFQAYMKGDKNSTKPGSGGIEVSANSGMPLNERHPDQMQELLSRISDNKDLTALEYERVIAYLQDRREQQCLREVQDKDLTDIMSKKPRTEIPDQSVAPNTQSSLQHRILGLLNKPNSTRPGTLPQQSLMGAPQPVVKKEPILQDPSVQRALQNFFPGNNNILSGAVGGGGGSGQQQRNHYGGYGQR